MTQPVFTKATRKRAKARVAIDGPSGSGKTWTALEAATALADGGKIAGIDTEHGSMSLYSDDFNFDVFELKTFSPQNYIDAIEAAEKAGYAVIVIDSLSHAWEGEGGALEMVDNIAAKSQSKNSYFAWRDVTPVHRRLVDAMLQSPCHIIATMRSKTEYVIETTSNGKQVPRKIGMAPIQRAGMEYEFTIVGDMDLDHKIVISKSRCKTLADKVEMKPGQKFWGILHDWLNSGTAAPAPTPTIIMSPTTSTPTSTQGAVGGDYLSEAHVFGDLKPTTPAVTTPTPKPKVAKPPAPEPEKSGNGNGNKPSDKLRQAWVRLVQGAESIKVDVQPWPAGISAEDAANRFESVLKVMLQRAEEIVKVVHDGSLPEQLYQGLGDLTGNAKTAEYNKRVISLAGQYFKEGKVELENA